MNREETIKDLFRELGEIETDPFTYLQENWPSPTGRVAQNVYAGLPLELKNYVNQHLLDYARLQPDLQEEEKKLDIQYLDRFLSVFMSVQTCRDDQVIDDDLAVVEEAFRAMAQELRRFYGREEHDDEVPVW